MPLQLHIFEKRYQQMIRDCVRHDRRFGVALIRSGQEALGDLAQIYDYGCTARILHIRRLAKGRRFVYALGEQRFIARQSDDSGDYLNGDVDLLARPLTSDRDDQSIDELYEMVDQYLQLLARDQSGIKLQDLKIESPISRLYFAAALLQIPNPEKQALLEITDPTDLISQTTRIYTRQLQLLDVIQKTKPDHSGSRGYSPN